ncbi:hypothetical protein J2W54_004744 [Rhodococcus fascians]|uniref:hypothetical protein n=1 Tax=Nocardiaceae TaxID=85025 RepID=UPI001C925665|nr:MULTISPECIES: hypothetical protein [Rhodococcus]MBY4130983.1 hypothetical protein [Rhodococcus fascians]MDJ0427283.1 hypothetical protein [Rhodococcus fascians]MDR6912601.1 hypothetical protein [Rhodococcus sp. 3258]MDR6934330.1 hypothetical protein [Rhodococcus fascians]
MSIRRTEKDVLAELSDTEKALLKRVLEIERSVLHLSAADPTVRIQDAVKEIIP